MSGNANLDLIFNPRSVAIVGVTTDTEHIIHNVAGTYLKAFLESGFRGPVYPVNHKGGEINGLTVYRTVLDVPGPLDYVVCCIQSRYVPQLIRDCAAKGVKAVQFFTAGFSESLTDDGRGLQSEIVELARKGGVRLIGPNCMGIYCPGSGMSFAPDFPRESGNVGYVCQSGGNAHFGIRYGARRGIRFSKVISYGNACDVDEIDLMEYMITDTETEIIVVYIEGVKDGRRFIRVLRDAVATKPVIVLKGGRTEAGARAAASHTGALAGSIQVWEPLLRQSGVITVNTIEEMADLLVTFKHLPVPQGRRLATLGISGGATVVGTDIYNSTGFVLPHLPQEIQNKLRSLVNNEAGLSFDNPVDISSHYFSPVNFQGFEILAGYEGVDLALFHLPLSMVPMFESLSTQGALWLLESVARVKRDNSKPIGAVVYNILGIKGWETAFECQEFCHKAGIPVYFSIESAAKTISRFIGYHERRKGNKQQV